MGVDQRATAINLPAEFVLPLLAVDHGHDGNIGRNPTGAGAGIHIHRDFLAEDDCYAAARSLEGTVPGGLLQQIGGNLELNLKEGRSCLRRVPPFGREFRNRSGPSRRVSGTV
jgi:hypothetical protein